MAPTTGQLTAANYDFFYSTDGTVFNEISGSSTGMAFSGFALMVGKIHVADGPNPILAPGKYEGGQATLRMVYTEVAGEAWRTVQSAWANRTLLYLRAIPKGTTAGNYRYTTSGYVAVPGWPSVDNVGAQDIVAVEATLEAGTLTVDTVP